MVTVLHVVVPRISHAETHFLVLLCQDEEVEDPGLGLIGKRDAEENDPVKQSSLFAYDDNADNPIFDIPLDEEEPEEEVDGDNVIEEPIELP